MMPLRRELPPTAGLPLTWRDLLGGGPARLARDAAGFLGAGDLLLTCSGTAALVVALMTLKQTSPRRTVIIPGFTCPLVPIAIAQCGLRVQTCDLVPQGLDMDPVQLRRLCDGDTLAVVPTHLAGRIADVAAARQAAAAVGARVIEDAAQAFGAGTPAGPVGTQGDFGLFSLAVGKGLTLYEGGLLHVRDATLRALAREVAAQLLRPDWWREVVRGLQLAGYAALYRPGLLALAYGDGVRRALRNHDPETAAGDRFGREIPLHAVGRWRQRVGSRALTRLAAFLADGRTRAAHTAGRFAAVPGVAVFTDRPGEDGVWPSLLLRLPDRASRDRALDRLWGAGLGVSRLFVHDLAGYDFLRDIVPATPCPQARMLADTSLSVGNSPWLTPADLDRITGILADAVA